MMEEITGERSYVFEKRFESGKPRGYNASYHVSDPIGSPVGHADVLHYGLKEPTEFRAAQGNEHLSFRLVPRRQWLVVRRFDMTGPDGAPIGSVSQRSGCRIRDRQGREVGRAIDPARLGGRLSRGLLGGAVGRYAFFSGNMAFGTFTSGTGGDPDEGEVRAAGRWWKRLTAPERWTLRWSPSRAGDLDERLLLAAGLVLWFVDVRMSRGSPG